MAEHREGQAEGGCARKVPARVTVQMAFIELRRPEKENVRVDEQQSMAAGALARADGPHIRADRRLCDATGSQRTEVADLQAARFNHKQLVDFKPREGH